MALSAQVFGASLMSEVRSGRSFEGMDREYGRV